MFQFPDSLSPAVLDYAHELGKNSSSKLLNLVRGEAEILQTKIDADYKDWINQGKKITQTDYVIALKLQMVLDVVGGSLTQIPKWKKHLFERLVLSEPIDEITQKAQAANILYSKLEDSGLSPELYPSNLAEIGNIAHLLKQGTDLKNFQNLVEKNSVSLTLSGAKTWDFFVEIKQALNNSDLLRRKIDLMGLNDLADRSSSSNQISTPVRMEPILKQPQQIDYKARAQVNVDQEEQPQKKEEIFKKYAGYGEAEAQKHWEEKFIPELEEELKKQHLKQKRFTTIESWAPQKTRWYKSGKFWIKFFNAVAIGGTVGGVMLS